MLYFSKFQELCWRSDAMSLINSLPNLAIRRSSFELHKSSCEPQVQPAHSLIWIVLIHRYVIYKSDDRIIVHSLLLMRFTQHMHKKSHYFHIVVFAVIVFSACFCFLAIISLIILCSFQRVISLTASPNRTWMKWTLKLSETCCTGLVYTYSLQWFLKILCPHLFLNPASTLS